MDDRNDVTIYVCVCLSMYTGVYMLHYILKNLYFNYFFVSYFKFLLKCDMHTEKYINNKFEAL